MQCIAYRRNKFFSYFRRETYVEINVIVVVVVQLVPVSALIQKLNI